MRLYRQRVELSQGNEKADDRRQLGVSGEKEWKKEGPGFAYTRRYAYLAHILSVLSLSTGRKSGSKV